MGRLWYIDSNGKRKRTKAGIKHEYKAFQSSPKQIAERDARNSARRSAMKKGLVHRGDGRDIHHVRGVVAGNGSSNLRVEKASTNRGHSEKSRKRGSRRNKSKWGK